MSGSARLLNGSCDAGTSQKATNAALSGGERQPLAVPPVDLLWIGGVIMEVGNTTHEAALALLDLAVVELPQCAHAAVALAGANQQDQMEKGMETRM